MLQPLAISFVAGGLLVKRTYHRKDGQGKGNAPADWFRPLHTVLTYWQRRALQRAFNILEAIDHDCRTQVALPACAQQTQGASAHSGMWSLAAGACCLSLLMLPDGVLIQEESDSLKYVYECSKA